MGKSLFISKTYYDRYQKFKCPLNTGFWHYSPNGCCLFINDRTQTIHHLYIRESCSLTKDSVTIQKILQQNFQNHENNDDDTSMIYDNDDEKFLRVVLQPYLNTITFTGNMDQKILKNMCGDSKRKILEYYDEILQQYWFIVCDMKIEIDRNFKNINDRFVQDRILKNIYGPLVFCSSIESLSMFLGTVTNRFLHQQMPLLNNIPADRLYKKLVENIQFIKQFPAQRMIEIQPNNNLYYIDARDLFDVVKQKNSDFITNMRSVHLTSESNFIDTWRRILFNFVHELVNIRNFEKQSIRIRSTCNVEHFIKGNNKSVIPEFRCNADNRNKCVHLMTRRKEYEILQSRNSCMMNNISSSSINNNSNSMKLEKTIHDSNTNNYTIALSSEGVLCRYVLEVMVDEYGEEAVEKELNFQCFFNNPVFEQPDVGIWERVIYESLGLDRRLSIRDGGSVSRERISCMQLLCDEKRMNDIHRFCIPKRFLTLSWFKWATDRLKLKVFESPSAVSLDD